MANEKRLIDANELLSVMRLYDERQKTDIWETSEVEYLLKELPTVDAVEVVHGRWEQTGHYGFLRCSQCKDVYVEDEWLADGKWSYCPNCGAKMDGDGNG